jgi:hypothetical protein
VFLASSQCAIVTTNCPLDVNTLALIINFIKQDWILSYIIVGLFETLNSSNAILAKQVKVMLVTFNLAKKL